VKERRSWLQTVWHSTDDKEVTYSKQSLLSSLDIDWGEVQWAANVTRSRYSNYYPSSDAIGGMMLRTLADLMLLTKLTYQSCMQELDSWASSKRSTCLCHAAVDGHVES
jgi:hypothetical protein